MMKRRRAQSKSLRAPKGQHFFTCLTTLVIVAVTLGACGSQGATSSSQGATSSRPRVSAKMRDSSARETVEPREHLLQARDLGASWRPKRFVPGSACNATPLWTKARLHLDSPQFYSDQRSIQEDVATYRTAREARDARRQFNSRGALVCFERTVRRQLRDAAERVGPLEVVRVSGEDGAQAVRWRVEVQVSVYTGTVFIDRLVTQAGARVATFTVISPYSPLDEEEYERIVRRLVDRLRPSVEVRDERS